MSVVRLGDIDSSRVDLYGGKAGSLAKLVEFGASVPDGFVLDASSFGKQNSEQSDASSLASSIKNLRHTCRKQDYWRD